MLMLSSYDYLGLIGDPRIDAAAIEAIRKYGTGTGGARLLTGTTDQHILMERDLAAYKGTEAAITFSSGYLANVAVLGALLGPADRVIMDSLCHRSLTDACRFAGVQLQRFRHNDASSLRQELQNGSQANRTLVISDGVFSMDGDVCHLPEILEVKEEFGFFLLVDESHASGVLGARGRGTDEHFGIRHRRGDIWTGSLAKSIPSTGGFAAVSQELAIYLQHGASPFIFSAALSPAAVAAIREGFAILQERAGAGRQDQAERRLSAQRPVLAGLYTGLSETAVIPVISTMRPPPACLPGDSVTTAFWRRRSCSRPSHRIRRGCGSASRRRTPRADLEYALDVFEKMARN